MFKWFSFLFILVLSTNVFADSYSISNYSKFDDRTFKKLNSFFYEEGFNFIKKKDFHSKNPLAPNQIFVQSYLSKYVFVKKSVGKKVKIGKLYKSKSGFTVHSKLKQDIIAFHYVGFDYKDVLKTHKSLGRNLKSNSLVSSVLNFVLPSANAKDCIPGKGTPYESLDAPLEPIEEFSKRNITSKLLGCLGDIKSSALSDIQAIGGGFKSFFSNPGAYWDKIVDTTKKVSKSVMTVSNALLGDPSKAFSHLGSIKSSVIETFESLAQLPEEEKWKYSCELIGDLGVGGLLALTGVGTARFAHTIIKYNKKLSRIKEKIKARRLSRKIVKERLNSREPNPLWTPVQNLVSLDGLTFSQARKILKKAGFRAAGNHAKDKKSPYYTFKHKDGSTVTFNRNDGEIDRQQKKLVLPSGQKKKSGIRVDKDGNEIPRHIDHKDHPKEIVIWDR